MYFVSFIDMIYRNNQAAPGRNGSQGLPDCYYYSALPPINFMLGGDALLG